MKTKIVFLSLAACSFFCIPKVSACYQYYTHFLSNVTSGTISANGIDCASNTSTTWFVDTGTDLPIQLSYYFNLPFREGNRLRIYRADSSADCYSCINGTPIVDIQGGGFASHPVSLSGCFVVIYDVAFVSRDYNTYLHISFIAAETIESNLHVTGSISTTDLLVSGNVGIGVANPVQKLQVAGTIMAEAIFANDLSSDGPITARGDIVGSGTISTFGQMGVGFGGTPSERLEVRGNIKADTLKAANLQLSGNANLATIRTTGNVGIGTGDSIPVEKLEVRGNIKADTLKAANLRLSGNANFATIRTTGNVGIGTGDSIPVEKLEVRGNIKADTLKAANLRLSGNANLATIRTTGNVGIGTGDSIPVEKLEVRGNIKADTLKAANLQLSGNANFATIRTTGNVGIGTGDSIPVEKLEVRGNIKVDTLKAANLRLDGNNSLGLDTIKAKDIRIDNVLGVVDDGIIVPDNSASTLPLYIYKHVNLLEEENSSNCIVTFSGKSTSAIKNSLWLRRDVTGSGGWGTARLHNGISVDGSYLQPGVDTRTWWERDPQDVIQSWGHADLTYMTLKGDKLGIGTENPAEKLDVNGKVKASGLQILSGNTTGLTTNSIGQKLLLYTNSANETASVYVNSNTTKAGTGGGSDDGLLVGIRASGIGTVWHRSAQPLTFGTSGMERMRIWPNGNIGIDTYDNPLTAKLEVNGTVKATSLNATSAIINGTIEAKKVTITATPGADFVFAPDYNLPKLETVEEHIKEKQHLPEIPSAKEMEENGVDIAELNIKLLQKIEELTLYVIEQNKRLSEQSERISTLEKALEQK